jgi:2-C-methyl-D-erythritol 4-phosphate cytidylyltransferase
MGAVWSIVVAGGLGRRFGGPKQFADLAGRPVAAWSVDTCRQASDGVVLVVPDEDRDPTWQGLGADRVVTGGPTRSASVRCGLAAVPDDADIVVVHDAARPLATAALVSSVVAALADPAVGGALCAWPMGDTVKRIRVAGGDGAVLGDVVETLEREELVTVQTPQAFRTVLLRAAHAEGAEATDDAALVERLGATVRVVAGDPRNIKITTPSDLALAELLLTS